MTVCRVRVVADGRSPVARHVLVTGDRAWSDQERVHNVLASVLADGPFVLIEGGAKGADRLAFNVALRLSIDVVTVQADWDTYGRAAGPIRNRRMLDLKPERVVAFHNDLAASKGTRDCVTEALRRGIPVTVYTTTGEYVPTLPTPNAQRIVSGEPTEGT